MSLRTSIVLTTIALLVSSFCLGYPSPWRMLAVFAVEPIVIVSGWWLADKLEHS